ncbi:MAG: lamin tail domain-containing protein [Bacteroidetes bacterium]|nr:lamin tail domain-containing protein [Bacteroidota bacterium]
MKRILLFFIILHPIWAYCQFSDDFTDGDFISNPTWLGNTADWTITTGQLNSNGPGVTPTTIYLSTSSALAQNAQWEFFANPKLATSSGNFIDVFLAADSASLLTAQNGYFVRLGNTSDDVCLYQLVNGTATLIIDGPNTTLASSSNNPTKVRVTRNASNLWTLEADFTGTGSAYAVQGTVTNSAVSTAAFFGVKITYSAANFNKYFFDDFTVTPVAVVDTTAPDLLSATVISGTQVDLLFSEALDPISAQNTTHYAVNNGIGSPASAVRDASSLEVVHLSFLSSFPNGILDSIVVDSIQDLFANTLIADTTTFTYTAVFVAGFKDVIVNEIMADPTPLVGLPNAEFLEIFNRSANPIDLNQWSFTDNPVAAPANLGAYVLQPDSFLIICSSTNLALFSAYSNVMGVASFPSLVNSGNQIYLKNNLGNFIDSVDYSDSWYQNTTKAQGGWTLELINPNLSVNCAPSGNWIASIDLTGGTPGAQNSVFSIAPDVTAPSAISSIATDSLHVTICFSEAIDASQIANTANYSINNGVGNPLSVAANASLTCVDLTLGTNLISQQTNSLSFSNISDCSGNNINPNTSNFTYFAPVPVAPKDIIITEIYSSPNATSGLPNAEYIELFNRSNAPINLNNWSFHDALLTLTPNIGNYVLQPDSFVVLCSSTSVALFAGFQNVLGITSFPTLNNSGDHIYLRNDVSTIIDSVSYTTSWYHDATKAAGGWSLELINPDANVTCAPDGNWSAAIDISGGTPGSQNSIYSNAPDITAPAVISILASDSLHVSICFSEAIDAAQIAISSNYSINNGIGTPTAVSAYNSFSCIDLTVGTNFVSQQINTLSFTNLSDCSGNLLSPNSINFSYFAPVVAVAKDIIISEIYSSPNATSGLPNAEYIELFNRSSNPINLNNWSFHDNINVVTPNISNYILKPDSFVVLCSTANVPLFAGISNVLGVSSFPALNNSGDNIYLRSDLVTIIDSVPYTVSWYRDAVKAAGGWSLELINPNVSLNCAPAANWIASTNPTGGTPGVQNSVYSTLPDITAPTLLSIFADDSVHVSICFSEAIDANQIGILSNYTINNGIGNPITVVPNSDLTCVTLTLATSLTSQQLNTLSFTSIGDCSGNLLISNTVNFTYFAPVLANYKDVIISEIYASNNPSSGLPNAEYIELFNRSNHPINLNNWSFHDDILSLTPNLTNYVLLPDSFVVICSTTNAALFVGITNVLGISSFPSLNNTGDHLYLRDGLISIIDSVPYSDTWYQDAVKAAGGWSLELINPNLNASCAPTANWIASNAILGGTPGALNSVYSTAPDVIAPQIISAFALDSLHVSLCFSEAIDASQISIASNYMINGSIGNPINVLANSDFTCVNLTLGIALSSQQTYTITVPTLSDCSGNLVSPASINFVYYTPYIAHQKDIIITEIYSSPTTTSGLPNAEYIELYNRSNEPINIGGWSIKDDTTGTINITNYILFPDSFVVLTSTSNVLLFPTNIAVFGLSSFPSLNNTGDHIFLKNNLGFLVDEVNYSDTWYRNNTKKAGGWSLELIDMDFLCYNKLNWIASTNPKGGTPGKPNSVLGTFTDTEAPSLLRAIVTSNSSVKLFFDEPVSYAALVDINTYTFDNGIVLPFGTSFTLDSDSTSVNIVLPIAMQLKTIYTVTVNTNIKDCSGNSISNYNSARFGLWEEAEYNDVVINEVLFDPISGGTDFIELYNRSTKVLDLSQLILSSKDTVTNELKSLYTIAPGTETYMLLPGEYLVLSENSEIITYQYYTPNPRGFWQMPGIPSLNISDGTVVLSTPQQKIIDDLHYYDSWQFPLLVSTKGVSLERINFDRSTQDGLNWHSASQNVGFATPSYKNSQYTENASSANDQVSIEPEVFSPDNDGYQDVVNISYKTDIPGYAGSISIFDDKGRLIRSLVKNELWGNAGTYSWDGITNDRDKARIGIYVILVEVFDLNGNSRQYKKTCVLGAKL